MQDVTCKVRPRDILYFISLDIYYIPHFSQNHLSYKQGVQKGCIYFLNLSLAFKIKRKRVTFKLN